MENRDAIKWLKTFQGHYGLAELEEAVDVAIKALEQDPCEDAISMDAAMDIFKTDLREKDKRVSYQGMCIDAVFRIAELPLVYPKPKAGHWTKTGQSFINPLKFRNYCCSNCLHELDEHIRIEPRFCPNCGAKMESEDKE